MPNPDSVLISMDIYHKRKRTEFVVMRTPTLLWEALPMAAKFIEVDYTDMVHYFKRIAYTLRGHLYEVTFYRSIQRVDAKNFAEWKAEQLTAGDENTLPVQ